MNHFRLVAQLDTFPVLPTLAKQQPANWAPLDICPSLGPSKLLRAHRDATKDNWGDDLPAEPLHLLDGWKSMQRLLAQARKAIMVEPLARQHMSGAIARARLTRLDPGVVTAWGLDEGPYHEKTFQFQIPLTTNFGCVLYAGPDLLRVEVGSLLWTNNHVQHCAANWGTYPRIHLIFDMYRLEQDPADDAAGE